MEAATTPADPPHADDAKGLAALSRLVEGAGDALTDDIVARLAQTAGDFLALADRLTRDGLAERLLTLVEHAEQSHVLADLVTALEAATKSEAAKPPSAGGVAGLWQVLKAPETQAALRLAATTLAEFRAARAQRGE